MQLQEQVKTVGDVAAGSVIAASWLDLIKGGLEIFGLILAVLYGVVRLYETKTVKGLVEKWRSRRSR